MEPPQLHVGSKVLVRSVLTREQVLETEGVFRGVTTVGASDALVLEVTGKDDPMKGKMRAIPTQAITSLDILEAAKPKEEKAREREDVHYT